MPILAVDMGGTSIKAGIVDDEKLIGALQIPANASASLTENVAAVNDAWQTLLHKHSIAAGTIAGVGMALPSIVDGEKARVISRFVKYKDAASFDFEAWAKETWNLPFVLENDARAALVGEWQYGAGKGCDTLAMLTLGTGVGSAVLLNGQLLRGRNFIAGNLWGHASVNLHGKECTCGCVGCLETESSAWVLKEKFESLAAHKQSSLAGKEISFVDVFNEAGKGDETAKDLVADCIQAWSVCAVNMVQAYDPQRIIFSGGVMEQAAIILPQIQSAIDNYPWLSKDSVKAVKAEQSMYGSLLGLFYLLKKKSAGAKI